MNDLDPLLSWGFWAVCVTLCLGHLSWTLCSSGARCLILTLQTGLGRVGTLCLETKVPGDSQVPKCKSHFWILEAWILLLFWDQGTERLYNVLYKQPKFNKQHSRSFSVGCMWVVALLWFSSLTVNTICWWEHIPTWTSPGAEVRSNKCGAVICSRVVNTAAKSPLSSLVLFKIKSSLFSKILVIVDDGHVLHVCYFCMTSPDHCISFPIVCVLKIPDWLHPSCNEENAWTVS